MEFVSFLGIKRISRRFLVFKSEPIFDSGLCQYGAIVNSDLNFGIITFAQSIVSKLDVIAIGGIQ